VLGSFLVIIGILYKRITHVMNIIPVVQREEGTTAEFGLPYLLFPPTQHPFALPNMIKSGKDFRIPIGHTYSFQIIKEQQCLR
jgi:hypothetical protein